MAFADKYKKAIIFLGVVLVITVVLVLVYFILKRGMCNCFGDKKKADEEEGLYTDEERDVEEEFDDHSTLPDTTTEDDDLPRPVVDLPNVLADDIVTEAEFVPEKKSKKKQISSMFKKIKKTSGRVRFDPASENTSLIYAPGAHNSGYGAALAPLRRTDSMESFMSGLSSATTNCDEFGEELSPSRIQVLIAYDPKRWMLSVGAKQAECLVTTNKETMYWQVHMTLLPFKKHKFKTKYKSTSTPIFNQTYEIENIAMQALTQLAVRYRVYGRPGRAGRKKLAGETEVELSHITTMEDNTIKDWRILKRKTVPHTRRESSV